MPVRVPVQLPAVETLREENIFVIDEQRAEGQDIRPLRIGILNLMPLKIMTETDLLRLISNTPLQVELDLIDTRSHVSRNTPREHIEEFYKTFEEIRGQNYDGFIITGAPLEMVEFEDVDYCTSYAKYSTGAAPMSPQPSIYAGPPLPGCTTITVCPNTLRAARYQECSAIASTTSAIPYSEDSTTNSMCRTAVTYNSCAAISSPFQA